jgi:molybdate transport system ATP-binding protein
VSVLAVAFAGKRGGFALDAAFEAPLKSVTALFGPSGSGKTSVLRAIAGLEKFEGHCRLGDEIWQDNALFVPPHQRGVGYVFQEASLFPQLDVRGNLSFGLKRTSGRPATGFDEVIELFRLGPLLARGPETLSGGERQRVALGRAILSQPKLLLLDEPMSALDRTAREEILPYFEALHRALTIPVLLVTHDIAEVERLADRMIVLRAGKVVAAGPLNDVLVGDVAGLRGSRDAASVLMGNVAGYDSVDGLSEIEVGGQLLLVAGRAGVAGAAVRVRIAARDVSLATVRPSQTTILNCLEMVIAGIDARAEADATMTLRLGAQTMLARVTKRSLRTLDLKVGQTVFAQVKGVSLVTGPVG